MRSFEQQPHQPLHVSLVTLCIFRCGYTFALLPWYVEIMGKVAASLG